MIEKDIKNKIIGILPLFVIIGVLIGFSLVLNYTSEEMRKINVPTKYEYKVINVEKGKTFPFDIPYYEVTYIDVNGLLITDHFETEKKLYVIISNESKIIIENSEFNGYPSKYTLYWNFER